MTDELSKKPVSLATLFGCIGVAIAGTFGLMVWVYGIKSEAVQYKVEAERSILQDRLERLRDQINASSGTVQYQISGQTISLDKNSFLVTRNEAVELLSKNYTEEDGLIFPDYEALGYKFHKNIRLKQLLKYLDDRSIPLPSTNYPDRESNPLWWPRCWAFTREAENNDEGAEILVIRLAEDKFLPVAVEIAKQNEINTKDWNDRYVQGIPTPLYSFVLLCGFASYGKVDFQRLQYVDGLQFTEGNLELEAKEGPVKRNFTFVSFTYSGDLFLIYCASQDGKPLSASSQEVRKFIESFKIVK